MVDLEANRVLIQEAGQIEDLTVSYRTMIWALQAPQRLLPSSTSLGLLLSSLQKQQIARVFDAYNLRLPNFCVDISISLSEFRPQL